MEGVKVQLGVHVLQHEGRRDVPSERPFRHHRQRVEFRGGVGWEKVEQKTRRDLVGEIDYISIRNSGVGTIGCRSGC